ncbi:MAG: immunoglobulin domain-containing protein, partial [Verrucomicrobiota bacterium]
MKKTTSLDVQRCVALAFFVSSLCIYAQPLATYDLSADYSTNANPNGVWAYGWKETTTGAFSNHTFFRITFNEAGGQDWVWARYSNDQSFIMRNGSSFDGSAGGGQARWAPGQMIIGPGHPLHNDNYGGVRFTVPNNAQGTHLVQVRVDDLYVGALSGDTDFHVVRSGVELVGVNIPASATTFTNGFGYTNQTILMAGETLDFLVGRGLDNSYNGSTLKINLTIKRLDEALAPPMFLIPLQGLTVYPGDNTALVAQVTGNAPLTYQWFFENNLIPDATNASLTLLNCQPSTVGNYTLVVSNMVGSVTSSPAMLTVTTNPSVNVTPTNAVVYITTSTSFVASASGPSPLTFQWQFNGSNLTGATNNVLALTNLTLAQSGAYQCVVMNPYASTTSAPVTLTVQTTSLTCVDDFDPVIDSNQWFSVGGAIATNYGGSVSGTKALVFTATSGTRQVTTRPLNTTSGGTISYYLRTGTNTYVYYWDRPDYVNEYTLLEYSVNQGSTWTTITNHSLVISNWTQFQMPIPAAAQSSYTLFRWRQYAYTTATSYNGDNWALEDVNINAMPTSPTITTGPSNQTVTVGGTVAFTSSATSTTPMMYQWYFSGQTINNATNSGLTLLNVTSNNAGGYFAVVSNLGGSATSGVATLTVIPPPSIVAVPSLTATPGTDLVVPITLVSRGTENVVSFSLAFDPARLSFRQVTMGEGAALAFPTFNSLQASNGLVG